MLGREIVPVRRIGLGVARIAYNAFRGNDYLLTHLRDFAQGLAEDFLAHPAAVDVGMIEQAVSGFVRGDNRFPPPSPVVRGNFGRVRCRLYCDLPTIP